MRNAIITPMDAKLKLEHYCAYQDRCHAEVIEKLKSLGQNPTDTDEIVVHLINQNFLDEERFARSFARGKHRIKFWGKIRIVNELKARQISAANIKLALTEITDDEYQQTLETTARRQWETIREPNALKKRKKFCDFLLRKGYESNLIYEKLLLLENEK